MRPYIFATESSGPLCCWRAVMCCVKVGRAPTVEFGWPQADASHNGLVRRYGSVRSQGPLTSGTPIWTLPTRLVDFRQSNLSPLESGNPIQPLRS